MFAGVQLFVILPYNSFYLWQISSNVSIFILDLSYLSLFFFVYLAKGLWILFIFSKHQLFVLLIFCVYLCTNFYYFFPSSFEFSLIFLSCKITLLNWEFFFLFFKCIYANKYLLMYPVNFGILCFCFPLCLIISNFLCDFSFNQLVKSVLFIFHQFPIFQFYLYRWFRTSSYCHQRRYSE